MVPVVAVFGWRDDQIIVTHWEMVIMSSWMAEAKVRVRELSIALGEADPDGIRLPGARETLTEAQQILERTRFGDWFTGNATTEVWGLLHNVEDRLHDLDTDTAHLVFEAREHLESDPARLASFEVGIHAAADDSERVRFARSAIRSAHTRSAVKMDSARNLDRGLVLFSLLGLVGAIALCVWQARSTERLLPPPTADSGVTALSLLVVVLLCGAIGGLLSAVFRLYLGRTDLEDTRWFDPRPGLGLAKVALGAWTGLAGILAVSTGAVTGVYTSLGSAILLAVVFGYSQEVVTRYLDRGAAERLEPVPVTSATATVANRGEPEEQPVVPEEGTPRAWTAGPGAARSAVSTASGQDSSSIGSTEVVFDHAVTQMGDMTIAVDVFHLADGDRRPIAEELLVRAIAPAGPR
ncbi:MAG: hypothetical protein HGA44_18335 [Cellulomonadaceae bacterium]|nr:hypothetical protein [Cellulomonadaceae bacterium]